LAGKRPALAGDDGALPFAAGPIVIDHNPVFGLLQFMGPRSIGKKRGVVALATLAMQDGQPGFAVGVETARRDGAQLAGRGFLTILAIDIQNLADRRFAAVVGARPARPRRLAKSTIPAMRFSPSPIKSLRRPSWAAASNCSNVSMPSS
jgi:hypothetical protein